MRSFDHCTALITGASSGIGREIALQLAPAAHTLLLVARRNDRLAELKDDLESINPRLVVECLPCDLSNEREVDDLASTLLARNVQVEFLVNNAGLGDHGPFYNCDPARIRSMIEVNIKALTHLTRALLPSMIASGHGAILNVSSVASFIPIPDLAVYAATKAYVTSFSEAIAAELKGTGVTVTALCPGPTPTEFFDIAERGSPGERQSPDWFKVPVEQVALDGLRAVLAERPRVVPGWHVWLLMSLLAALPMFLLRGLLARRSSC